MHKQSMQSCKTGIKHWNQKTMFVAKKKEFLLVRKKP